MISTIRGVALFVSVLLAHASIVHAAPAHDATFALRQPDGTPFEARLFGDEWMNGTETVEGYTIVRDATSGYWTYANATSAGALVSTVYVVGRDRPSAIPRGLRPPAITPAAAPEGFGPEPGVPAMGSRPMLVLLVQFSDQRGHTTAAQWRSRFFGAGMSVREHYRSASLGGLDIRPAAERHGTANDGIVGWLTLDRAHPDFGGTIDGRAGQLARDAMTAASRHVDFAAFDTDGDGRVSTSELLVVVVVAGHDASLPGACRPSVWSHQSAIRPLPLDGVQLSPYAMVGESHCAAPTTLDNITHEVDHLLGMADIAAAEQSLVGPLATLATLTLTAPNGDEGWTFNSRRLIAWTSSGVSGNVRLELSRNAGATWTVIAASTPNDGAFNWTVTGPATNRARVRVCSVNTPALCDASNRNFRIAAALITVVTPNGGESWVVNTTRQIQWTSAGPVGSTVRIELSRNAGASWTPIFASIANDGAQNWPVTGPATTAARIRVCSVATPSICDASNANFTISNGRVRVVTPNGGESWPVGGERRIEWTSSVAGNVRIEVSRDGGASWTPIFPSIANDGAQNWTVTGPGTSQARIRVCSIVVPTSCDTSDADFAISEAADLTVRFMSFTPTDILGGQSWLVRVQTANDGVAAAAASRTDVFISPTSATGAILITSINVPALAPGAVSDQRKIIAFPFTVPPNTYFVFVRVDATGVVPEGDEANEFVLLTPTLLVH